MSDLTKFKKYIKTVVPQDTLLIIQVPGDQVQKTSQELSAINGLLDSMRIRLLVAPDHMKFTVVKGSKTGLKKVEFLATANEFKKEESLHAPK